jgi:acid phosphatase
MMHRVFNHITRKSLMAGLPIAFVLALPCSAIGETRVVDKETTKLRGEISNVVVIVLSGRSVDNIFGRFPGAHGLSEVLAPDGRPSINYKPQRDRNGAVLSELPPIWGGVTAAGFVPVITQQQSTGLENSPFAIESAFLTRAGVHLSTSTVTRDQWGRFFENQMQINSGQNDGYAAWSDAGGLPLAYFDYTDSALYKLAREYTLADNLFQGAFGGGFLNHQYIVCACAPVYPDADAPMSGSTPSISLLEKDSNEKFLPRLLVAPTQPASALDGPPRFLLSGNLTPANYFGDGKYHTINTMQPAFQPSGNRPSPSDTARLYADPATRTTLPPLVNRSIGDVMSSHGVTWTWYAELWNAAISESRNPTVNWNQNVIYGTQRGYMPHLSPFNYYAAFDPVQHANERRAHLKDYEDLLADVAAGRLPSVTFYEPSSDLIQHSGITNLETGDKHVAELVESLKAGPQWPKMMIIIIYADAGGAWDHVAPPRADLLGPGLRVPAIIVSPRSKRGFVDHTQMDTGSIQRLIARLFDVERLPGIDARDQAARNQGSPAFGDFTSGLDLR